MASETSADSVEVLLAKAVLARAKRKKLRGRQRSPAASLERLPEVNTGDGLYCGPHDKVSQGKSHHMYAHAFDHNSV